MMKKCTFLKAITFTMGIAGGLLSSLHAADAPPAPAAASDPATAATSDYKGTPYSGTPQAVPGIIKAITYDLGGADVAFGYKGSPKQTQYRTSPDSIGIAGFGKGHMTTKGEAEAPEQVYVGWTQPGEWLKYTVKVSDAGTYVIGAKLAAGAKGGKLTFSFSPDLTTGPIDIPTTAGFQPGVEVYHVWEKLDNLAEVKLPAGVCVMTVKMGDVAGMNFESFTLTKKP
jgi:DUF5010 C-terminal domain